MGMLEAILFPRGGLDRRRLQQALSGLRAGDYISLGVRGGDQRSVVNLRIGAER